MARVALAMAFFAAGFGFAVPRLFWHANLDVGPFLVPALCGPAVLLGTRSWLRHRSFANSWPVAVCALWVWLGLLYADPTESKRGILHAFKFSMVLPIAALVVEQRAWWFCARVLVIGSATASLITAWLQYGVERRYLVFESIKFGGFKVGEDHSQALVNSGAVGCDLAIAALLAFLLHLQAAARAPVGPGHERAPGRFSLAWTVLLSGACMLTAARGPFVAWFVGMGLLAAWGTRSLDSGRLKGMVGLLLAGLLLAATATTAVGVAPWSKLSERFSDEDNLMTLGGRIGIWQNAVRAWQSSAKHTVIGAGTGMSRELLGAFDENGRVDQYGNVLRSPHSMPLEWLLCYGLGGIPVAICLLTVLVFRAVQLDRRDPVPHRKAILAYGMAVALTEVIHVGNYWIALGSLGLAMLSDPPGLGRTPRPVQPATAWPLELPPAPRKGRQECRPVGGARRSPALAAERSRP